jgi:hypothetical protein
MALLTQTTFDRIASAMDAAEAVVIARYRQIATDRNGRLTDEEITQMKREVRAAGVGAMFTVMAATMVFTVLPGAAALQTTLGPSGPTGPPAAPVPLQPGVGFTIT